jgi:hypothetical protein
MWTLSATKVSVGLSWPTSSAYPGTGAPSIAPRVYCPVTVICGASAAVIGRSARKTFTFSSRTAAALKSDGGSIATSARSWSMWFWTMSRSAPALS